MATERVSCAAFFFLLFYLVKTPAVSPGPAFAFGSAPSAEEGGGGRGEGAAMSSPRWIVDGQSRVFLEQVFASDQFPSRHLRTQLAAKLSVTARQVVPPAHALPDASALSLAGWLRCRCKSGSKTAGKRRRR